ncbi:MAG: acyltransferase [Acidithiobacillus ferrooxidans]|nr:acyltransferase [Acidithiobacillus ferrooxidans]MDD5002618.1 acyltransferase [Acidithiobacillus sp.]MDD5379139.1 acyltransferase [Acidithiobacillus sp.]MDD5575514.1 acyltransferase [Acidithiobacillus sp.]
MAAHAPSPERGHRLPLLQALRGLAALLVVYDHLVGMWPRWHHLHWGPAVFVNRWVFTPLGIMMHGGALGVALFFLLSGFVISMAAQRENRWQFFLRRALRIFPPFWVSVAFIIAMYGLLWTAHAWVGGDWVGRLFTPPGLLVSLDISHLLANVSLLNYLLGWPPINGVAWTLIIEALFYLWAGLILPLLQTRPRAALFLSWTAIALLQWQAHAGMHIYLLAANAVYLTFLFLGVCLYFFWAGRIGRWSFVFASIAFWGLFLHGTAHIVAQAPYTLTGYGVSYGLAWLLFALLLLVEGRVRPWAALTRIGDISYSLYLYHGAAGLVLLSLLTPALGYPIALALALIAAVTCSWLSWRYVERPSQGLARHVTKRLVAAR